MTTEVNQSLVGFRVKIETKHSQNQNLSPINERRYGRNQEQFVNYQLCVTSAISVGSTGQLYRGFIPPKC